eukprot:5286225-Prymnesium_polylepis.1
MATSSSLRTTRPSMTVSASRPFWQTGWTRGCTSCSAHAATLASNTASRQENNCGVSEHISRVGK